MGNRTYMKAGEERLFKVKLLRNREGDAQLYVHIHVSDLWHINWKNQLQ